MPEQRPSPYSWRHKAAAAALLIGGPAIAAGCSSSDQEGNTFTRSLELNESIEELSSDECEEVVRSNLKADNEVIDGLRSDVCANVPFAEGFEVYDRYQLYTEEVDGGPNPLLLLAIGGVAVLFGPALLKRLK